MKRKLQRHYERWNIEVDRKELFRRLKNRILLGVDKVVGQFLADDDGADKEFALTLTAEKFE